MKLKLLEVAAIAQKNSHSPYSKAQIGAGVIFSDGKIYSGCNIENASYGGTVCAERVAIWKGISENAKLPLKEVLVVSDFTPSWPPCGLCRQVIAEFCSDDTLIHLASPTAITQTLKFSEIFPMAFKPDHLLKP